MKTITKILTVFAASALLAQGCINEDPAYLKEQPVDPTVSKGYLALSGVGMRVVVDAQTESQGDSAIDDSKPSGLTRAGETIDTSNFIIEITDANNASVQKMTYAEMQALTTPIELAVGSYHIAVRSEAVADSPAAAWEHPVYGASRDFSITKDATTKLEEIVCTLQNIKVTVACSADLVAALSTDSKAAVSLGTASLDFALNDTRSGFYMPAAATNTLTFHMTGTYLDTNSPVEFTKTVTNVKAGQWRKITMIITHSSNGSIAFDIKVDSFVQDDEVAVNGTNNLWEPLLDELPEVDPTAPTITWADHDLSETFQLTASMFDTDGNCTEPFTFDLASPNGIKSFIVTISSTNSTFMDALAEANLKEPFDLCNIQSGSLGYTILRAFGFPLGSSLRNQTAKSFNLAGAMPQLYIEPGYEGTHTFAFALTDNNGLTSNAALTILIDKASEGAPVAAPTIEWPDHDLSQPYTIADGMEIDINIAAPGKIKSLYVKIISNALTPKELAGVGIPAEFDLCNVPGIEADPDNDIEAKTPEEVIEALTSDLIGFPVNDDVKGKTEMVFSLTKFVPMLMQVAKGYSNSFELTVTDSKNQSVSKTLTLVVPAN